MIDWLLVDYGEVLSRALPEATFTELAAIADLRGDEFRERYWRYRPDYDRGQSPLRYWSAALDRGLTRQRRLVERLTAADVNGWTRLSSATLRTTPNTARRTRTRLALLSNAPEPLAHAIEHSHWVRHFDHRFYSCRLRRLKPEPGAFTDALRIMDAAPEHVLFIDDRAENTAAAADLGISTITFTSADALDHQLTRATESRLSAPTEPDRELPTSLAAIAREAIPFLALPADHAPTKPQPIRAISRRVIELPADRTADTTNDLQGARRGQSSEVDSGSFSASC